MLSPLQPRTYVLIESFTNSRVPSRQFNMCIFAYARVHNCISLVKPSVVWSSLCPIREGSEPVCSSSGTVLKIMKLRDTAFHSFRPNVGRPLNVGSDIAFAFVRCLLHNLSPPGHTYRMFLPSTGFILSTRLLTQLLSFEYVYVRICRARVCIFC